MTSDTRLVIPAKHHVRLVNIAGSIHEAIAQLAWGRRDLVEALRATGVAATLDDREIDALIAGALRRHGLLADLIAAEPSDGPHEFAAVILERFIPGPDTSLPTINAERSE